MNKEILEFHLRNSNVESEDFIPPVQEINLYAALEKYRAIKVKGILTKEECTSCAQRIYLHQTRWNVDYEGEQYTLGQNYYAMHNGSRVAEYFQRCSESTRFISDHFSSELTKLYEALCVLIPSATIKIRKGWCGPGFVIFPTTEVVAKNNGPIHIDAEGLVDDELIQTNARACALVLMVQKPEVGGGVRVWDYLYDPNSGEEELLKIADNNYMAGTTIEYEEGDLVILNSLSPHQILSFTGEKDRITLNAFGSYTGGEWFFWF